MNQLEFHKYFKSPGPVILPVVHSLDQAQTERNVQIAIQEGASGVLLINHDISVDAFLPIIRSTSLRFPALWMGVNFLSVTGRDAFPILGDLQRDGIQVDAYWADDARIDETRSPQDQAAAAEIQAVREGSGWNGLYFGGTCFKKQREVAPEFAEVSARIGTSWMDVVTTSGIATGFAPELSKIEDFRRGVGNAPLALASGITADNAPLFAGLVDCFIVGTGINYTGDFHNFDPDKVANLMRISRQLGGTVEIG